MADLNVIQTFTPDPLFAGNFPVESIIGILDTGNLIRGTVLGKITATGKLVICDSAGTDDGRRTPYGILAEDADATSADKNVVVYLSGSFNEKALVFGGTDTIDTHRDALRNLSIFARKENRQS